MIEENVLRELITQGLSTWKIAKETGNSQTNVRHYIKKYKIERPIGTCEVCGVPLKGKQRRLCSSKCKNVVHQGYNSSYNAQKLRGLNRKKQLIEESGGGCIICGYNKCIAALDFHHRSPEEKEFKLDAHFLSNRKWEKIEEEARKCDLLCANCHRELHYKLKNL